MKAAKIAHVGHISISTPANVTVIRNANAMTQIKFGGLSPIADAGACRYSSVLTATTGMKNYANVFAGKDNVWIIRFGIKRNASVSADILNLAPLATSGTSRNASVCVVVRNNALQAISGTITAANAIAYHNNVIKDFIGIKTDANVFVKNKFVNHHTYSIMIFANADARILLSANILKFQTMRLANVILALSNNALQILNGILKDADVSVGLQNGTASNHCN